MWKHVVGYAVAAFAGAAFHSWYAPNNTPERLFTISKQVLDKGQWVDITVQSNNWGDAMIEMAIWEGNAFKPSPQRPATTARQVPAIIR